jgi:hypothetical protein
MQVQGEKPVYPLWLKFHIEHLAAPKHNYISHPKWDLKRSHTHHKREPAIPPAKDFQMDISLVPAPKDISVSLLSEKLAAAQQDLGKMAAAVVGIAVAAKITYGTAPLTGAQVLHLASAVTDWIRTDRGDVSRFLRTSRTA